MGATLLDTFSLGTGLGVPSPRGGIAENATRDGDNLCSADPWITKVQAKAKILSTNP